MVSRVSASLMAGEDERCFLVARDRDDLLLLALNVLRRRAQVRGGGDLSAERTSRGIFDLEEWGRDSWRGLRASLEVKMMGAVSDAQGGRGARHVWVVRNVEERYDGDMRRK
eukprot:745758-Hanusia_phi.AAC.5